MLLNNIFSRFDELLVKHSLEKIKTIGDNYMLAGGIPEPSENHAVAVAEMALDMLNILPEINKQTKNSFQIRIGINSGPVSAGVIGKKKFIYDLWGDAVNVASRMETFGEDDCIHITESTLDLLKNAGIELQSDPFSSSLRHGINDAQPLEHTVSLLKVSP